MSVMKRRVWILIVPMILLVISLSGADAKRCIRASKIFFNGKIFTSDMNDLWKDAIAIKRNRILRVGTDEDVLTHAGPRTEIYDLEGRLLIPGLNNAFVHVQPSNVNGPIINDPSFIPGPGPSVSEVLIILESAVQSFPEGTWLWILIGDAVLDDPAMTRFVMDAVTPDHPVIAAAWSGTKVYFNTYAMNEMGISENEPDPFGGSFGRVNGTDMIDGSAYAYAVGRVLLATREMMPLEILQAQYDQVVQRLLIFGVTTVQDHALHPLSFQEDITGGIQTPIRIRNVAHPFTIEESRYECRPGPGFRNPFKKVWSGGVAWLADGTPVERGAALLEPYADQPDWYGIFNFTLTDFDEMVKDARQFPRRYKQRMFYAAGDRSVENILNAMESIAPDWKWQKHRIKILHPEILSQTQIDRLASKKVTALQIPTHFTMAELLFNRLGPDRMGQVMKLRSLIDSGIVTAIASDTGAVSNPFLDMLLAVIHPVNPSEAISLEQALIAYTLSPAVLEFMEFHKGTLKPGKLADISVLSQDIFSVPIWSIPDTRSEMTIINGQIVHETGVLISQ